MQWGLGIGTQEGVLLGANLGRGIVTTGDFSAYVCYSAATRPLPKLLWADLLQRAVDTGYCWSLTSLLLICYVPVSVKAVAG